MNKRLFDYRAVLLAACGPFLLSANAFADSAAEWLDRMRTAIESEHYEGVVLRQQSGKVETLTIRRAMIDGVLRERLTSQEGSGMEFLRTGDEVHCVLPDKRAVLIDTWESPSMLFTSIPASSERFSSAYSMKVKPAGRVAGRSTTLLAIEPDDGLRFSHRLWLDFETAMPLRTQIVDGNDTVLSEIRFAAIDLDADLQIRDFETDHDLADYRWVERRKDISTVADTDWDSDALPVGFERVSVHDEVLRGSDTPATHILYSDGLSSVSVFIEPAAGRSSTTRSSIGGANSFSTTRSGYRITAVGEVPVETAERIALSMRKP